MPIPSQRAVLKEIEQEKFDFIAMNFANPDLVGHAGKLDAEIKALEVVDECLGKIVTAVQKVGGEVLLIGDHGNAEQMFYEDDEACPAHTINPVPCVLISDRLKDVELKEGQGLSNVAPTLPRNDGS